MHSDKHVVKMVLESAQMLCCAHRILDNREHELLYRKTHANHPCNIWVRSSHEAYDWLYDLFEALCEEFTFRRGKTHLCETKFGSSGLLPLKTRPLHIPHVPMPEFAQCMPDEYKVPGDAVAAYKNYYINEKAHLLQYDWGRPSWI